MTVSQQAETGQGDSNPMSEAVEVSGDPVEEEPRYWKPSEEQIREWMRRVTQQQFRSVDSQEAILTLQREHYASRALAAEAERDTWKRAYRGASENCEAAEQRVEEAIADFEEQASELERQADHGTNIDFEQMAKADAYRACASYLRGD